MGGRPCPPAVYAPPPPFDPDDVIGVALVRLAAGEVSARELVDECATAIDKRDAELAGYAELWLDDARAAAAASDRARASGESLGPLAGIPLSVKDVIDVAGMSTRCGSLAYEDLPAVDATAVACLRDAGAIILGKATTHEFALGVTSPQSRNPHDPTRIPGGSSGGSAVTVACGMALGSLGTDTRASIRVPAALCGIVGLKPTFGTVPTEGVVPLSWSMDHVAPMARTVRDAALLLDVSARAGGTLAPWATTAVRGWRLGAPTAAFDGCEPEVSGRVERAFTLLAELGCPVIELDRPSAADLDDANAGGLYVSRSEAATYHRARGGDLARYWPEVADQLDEAGTLLAIDYLDAQRLRADLGSRMIRLFDEVDLLVMPTVPV
ncbi:MAG TPA: amidase, partial [Acidimicrobiales bacterium]|nr:amidase [Acidimicrobiales bacterium]